MARPKLDIDEQQVAQLAEDGARNTDIADVMGCDEGTIRKRFSEILRKSRSRRRMQIRKLQMLCASSGNPTMLIWLGKQELDQTDKQELKSDGQINITINRVEEPVRQSEDELHD